MLLPLSSIALHLLAAIELLSYSRQVQSPFIFKKHARFNVFFKVRIPSKSFFPISFYFFLKGDRVSSKKNGTVFGANF